MNNLKILGLFAIVVVLFFAPVVFFQRSFIPSLYMPDGVGDLPGYTLRPTNTYQVDLATPAFYEQPVNKTIGNLLRNGELPLWNPHQGLGMPLLGQYSSRALYPPQLLYNILPYWLWDYLVIARFIVAGFFTFLFLRRLGASAPASFAGGIMYQFCGSMTWFYQLQQFSNFSLLIPAFLLAIDMSLADRRRRFDLLLSLMIAMILYAGQPETALYVLLLGFGYTIFKMKISGTLSLPNARHVTLVWILGFCFAAPQIFMFLDTMVNSFHLHPPEAGMGVFSPAGLNHLKHLLLPGLTPEMMAYRPFPHSGKWDWLGGYLGLTAWMVLLPPLLSRWTREKTQYLFFCCFGLLIVLKNFNIWPFYLIGYLPLFDMVWTPRWAGCVWTFCLAIAAGLALDYIDVVSNRMRAVIIGLIMILAVVSLRDNFTMMASADTIMQSKNDYYDSVSDLTNYNRNAAGRDILADLPWRKFLLSVRHQTFGALAHMLCWSLFLLAACSRKAELRHKIISITLLAFTELWYYFPRGYDYRYDYILLLTLACGWLATLVPHKIKRAVGLVLVMIGAGLIVELRSPCGLPVRRNPYAMTPVTAVLTQAGDWSRITGIGGVMMPNAAGAYGLYDVRSISALAVKEYHYFYNKHLLSQSLPRFDCLWLTGITSSLETTTTDDLGPRLHLYSWLGTRYIVTPDSVDLPLPLKYQARVKVYENPDAFPRAYLVYRAELAADFKQAQAMTADTAVDLRQVAFVETEDLLLNGEPGSARAAITDYRANQVTITAMTDQPALLILTDNYYPGWECRVDGNKTAIARVNGLVRGVLLQPGSHTIVFRYMPMAFLAGIFLAGIALVICVLLARKNLYQRSDY